MNEELQGTLNDALVSMIESAASAKNFILAETPEVIEQLLMWEMVSNLIGVAVGLAMSFATYKLSQWLMQNTHKQRSFLVECLLPMLVVILAGFSLFLVLDFTWLKILIAPKLYLLEYAADLVK